MHESLTNKKPYLPLCFCGSVLIQEDANSLEYFCTNQDCKRNKKPSENEARK